MLTLRTEIGLTQAGLANELCISRRAVGEWEAGNSYPKAEHLKKVIALAIQQEVFPAGHEVEEIRALWRAAHQKILLDERWLSILLSQRQSPQAQALWTRTEPAHPDTGDSVVAGQEQGKEIAPLPTLTVGETVSGAPMMVHPEPGSRVDWGDALAFPAFYGREQELVQISHWVVQERTPLVSVLGMGGIGKSTLSTSLMHRLAVGTGSAQGTIPTGPCPLEVVIFRSLCNAPSCEALLDECLQVLSPPSREQAREDEARHRSVEQELNPVPLERRIGLLLEHLRKTRTLVILDNLECLLKEGDVRGHFRPGFEDYGQLLRRVTETVHQSCLLLISREKPADLRLLEGKYSFVRSLRLTGLDTAACKQLLAEKKLVGTEQELASLIEIYGGNPLALKVVAEAITDLFGGVVSEFLVEGPLVFGSITDLLDEQFARLSALEQSVLRWLAIVREPMTLDELLAMQVIPLSRVKVLEAIDAIRRRSLIEPGQRPGSFALQSVMLEYVTSALIAEAASEIKLCQLDLLIKYSLELACCKENVRQSQERLLLSPLLTILQSAYREQDELEERLLDLLAQLREKADLAQGYGPTNLIALLRLLRGHLNGLDLSQLAMRSAYLQGIEMKDTDLSGALMCDAVFTEDICATCAVAISPDGRWWAASGMQGKVRVWKEGGRILHLNLSAHADLVQSLAFSPDGRTLASGSVDGTVKLWDVDGGVLLWRGWQNSPQSLAFSPDSSLLASAGLDATVQLWNPKSGANLQTLRHPGQVFAVAFSPDGCLLASSCYDGEICLWERQKVGFSTGAEIFLLRTSWGTSPAVCLAFAPDGRTLASANWDRMVRLWGVSNSPPCPTALSEQMKQARRIAWSPDGRTLAGSNSDKTIWLWDVEQDRYRAVLHGHTAEVHDVAFTPDSRSLLSVSADNTLRMWDVKRGQCMRVVTGYAVSLYDLDWSPDGMQLVCGGSDGRVTIWNLGGGTPSSALRGHSWIVRGVEWSPDGRFIASCGWDMALRVWDAITLSCVQKFEDSSAMLEGMAWSPDGSLLACGTYARGVQVWDVNAGSLRWVGQTHLITFSNVAWSPDGTRLVGGGDDGCVYLWDGMDGRLLERLSGHHGKVASVRWSPDGTQLASGGGNGELFVWDAQSGEHMQIFAGHPHAVSAVVWCRGWTDAVGVRTGASPVPTTAPQGPTVPGREASSLPTSTPTEPCGPRGDWLVSGDTEGRLGWWDVQSGQCLSIQAAHQGTVQSLRISPEGKRLASCGDDGAIVVWDLASAERLQTLRRDRPYERLDITGIRGLTEAQKATLQMLGAMEDTALPIE
jgi:WD40 repeat protein/transcriptional regulator with XRE-family HTH domain